MKARVLFALAFVFLARCLTAAPLDDAIALYKEKKLPEARSAFEKIAAAEPQNSTACLYLGKTLLDANDPALQENAIAWLGKAVELAPNDVNSLFEYGEASLKFARKNRSLSPANRGRDALEKIVQLDPAHVNARAELYQFYQEAPWPIGNNSKASIHLEEIRKRDPDRAALLVIETTTNAKDYAEAFKLCDAALARKPDNYAVLLQYARLALKSGQKLEPALAGLRKCLTLTPPPDEPGLAFVHWRIGSLLERLDDRAAARAAYEASLGIDPHFAQARTALENLNHPGS